MAIPDDIAEALVSAHERMDAQFKRIAQIEKILSEDGITADGFDKRIRELEGQENALDAAALLELRDRDRQGRWHATRDAFVAGRGPCYARNDAEYAAYTDALHKAAKGFADRAHGPLEVKSVPLKTLAVCSEVDALVKAARAACDLALPDSVGYDLTLALEPFETERGE